MMRLSVAALATAVAACNQAREAPAPPPTTLPISSPEPDLEEEFTRAVLPPLWVEGQTWTVETRVPMVAGEDAQIYWVGNFHGFAHYRVLERTEELAVIEATATSPGGDWLANHGGTWTLTFVLEPFHLERYEFYGKKPHMSRQLYEKELDLESNWAFQQMGVGDTLVIYSLPTALDHLPRGPLDGPSRGFHVLPGVACWWWREAMDVRSEGYGGDRVTHWLPGDPWWIRSEGIADDWQVREAHKSPARGRLVSIDGVAIEPWPWIEDVLRDPSNSPLEQAAEDGRCSAGIR